MVRSQILRFPLTWAHFPLVSVWPLAFVNKSTLRSKRDPKLYIVSKEHQLSSTQSIVPSLPIWHHQWSPARTLCSLTKRQGGSPNWPSAAHAACPAQFLRNTEMRTFRFLSAEGKGIFWRCWFLRGREKTNSGGVQHLISSGSKILFRIEKIKSLPGQQMTWSLFITQFLPHWQERVLSFIDYFLSFSVTPFIDLPANVVERKYMRWDISFLYLDVEHFVISQFGL